MIKLTFSSMIGCACALAIGCSDEADTGGGGDSAGGGSTTSGVPGEFCVDVVCAYEEYCGFAPGTCDGPESCQPFPAECGQEVACGCDGQNYEGPCIARDASGGILSEEACAPPDGMFTCSYEYQVPIYCDLGTEYCHVTPTGNLYELQCLPVPAACEAEPVDCSCLADPCSDNYCGIDDEDFSITVLCPLP
jgi:hypothetical protein